MSKLRPHRLKVWKDKRGEFRWRLTARNGKCIQASSEGFKRYRSCRDSVASVLEGHQLPVPESWPWGAVRMFGNWSKRSGAVEFVGICRGKMGNDTLAWASQLLASPIHSNVHILVLQ